MEESMPRQPKSASAAFLSVDLIIEIISWLPVKHVIQFRCVNKFFKTLIFDPHFVQMHLNKSSRNSHLALMYFEKFQHNLREYECFLLTLSIPRLLQNQFTTIHNDPYYRLEEFIIGSCNGLLCLLNRGIWFWNPAMRTKSENFTIFSDPSAHRLKFSFGYDNFTRTYKVVAFYYEMKLDGNAKCVIKVFTLGDNTWRDIQCLPKVPLYSFDRYNNNGVHLNGTINWLALLGYSCSNYGFCSRGRSFTVEHYVIVSLDLSTETYTELLLPRGFAKVPRYPPKLVVLMDCLCFCHDFEETHFIIWQMKDFGVQESWIQLFKISYEIFVKWVNLLPMYLSENDDTLILVNYDDDEAFIYNCRDNRVEKIGITNKILWGLAKDYVESLVSTH